MKSRPLPGVEASVSKASQTIAILSAAHNVGRFARGACGRPAAKCTRVLSAAAQAEAATPPVGTFALAVTAAGAGFVVRLHTACRSRNWRGQNACLPGAHDQGGIGIPPSFLSSPYLPALLVCFRVYVNCFVRVVRSISLVSQYT